MYLASLPMYAFDNALNVRKQWFEELLFRVNLSPSEVKWCENIDNLREHWARSELLLSQTCGYPLVSFLGENVQLVGTLAYRAPGCDDSDYSSVIIARKNDTRQTIEQFFGARLVINEWHSQSGFNALRLYLLNRGLLTEKPFFGSVQQSGAHYNSVKQIALGQADIASIDCVTFDFMMRDYKHLVDKVKVIGYTEKYPGLPLITSASTSNELLLRMRMAIRTMVQDKALKGLNSSLKIKGFNILTFDEYARRIILPKETMSQL